MSNNEEMEVATLAAMIAGVGKMVQDLSARIDAIGKPTAKETEGKAKETEGKPEGDGKTDKEREAELKEYIRFVR